MNRSTLNVLVVLCLLLAPACNPGENKVNPVDDSSVSGMDSGGDDSTTQDSADTGEPWVSDADLVVDPSLVEDALLGFGAHIWESDEAWTTALDDIDGNLVRLAVNPNLGADGVDLPVEGSAEDWDAWLDSNILDLAPTLLDDLQATRALTDEREIDWIVLQWEAPPAWESVGVLSEDHILDYARLWGALVAWLSDHDLEPRYIELANEPDGDWNSYIAPEHYDRLVIEVRDDLDARGLETVGIVGPGLAVLGGWSTPPDWVPVMSEEAVTALEAWSVHTWDDYAEDGEGHVFLEERWDIFLGQVEARDRDKPILVTEMGSKDTVFDGITYGSPDPTTCGYASESDGYAIRLLAHTAVALSWGADGIVYWEGADQSWECSRWGMVDGDGEPRRFEEALSTFLMGVPENAAVVPLDDADLAAVAMVSSEAGSVLLVNDGVGGVTRSVGFAEAGWSLESAKGFGIEDRLVRDELIDMAQAFAVSGSVAIDETNSGYFDGDNNRLYRTAAGGPNIDYSVPGTLEWAEVVAWSWPDEAVVAPTLAASVDGVSWTEIEVEDTVESFGWDRHRMVARAFPVGSAWLRITFPDTSAEVWNPQIGDVSLRFVPTARGVLPDAGETAEVTLLPGSAAILRFRKE